jgi:hypothetical protein
MFLEPQYDSHVFWPFCSEKKCLTLFFWGEKKKIKKVLSLQTNLSYLAKISAFLLLERGY